MLLDFFVYSDADDLKTFNVTVTSYCNRWSFERTWQEFSDFANVIKDLENPNNGVVLATTPSFPKMLHSPRSFGDPRTSKVVDENARQHIQEWCTVVCNQHEVLTLPFVQDFFEIDEITKTLITGHIAITKLFPGNLSVVFECNVHVIFPEQPEFGEDMNNPRLRYPRRRLKLFSNGRCHLQWNKKENPRDPLKSLRIGKPTCAFNCFDLSYVGEDSSTDVANCVEFQIGKRRWVVSTSGILKQQELVQRCMQLKTQLQRHVYNKMNLANNPDIADFQQLEQETEKLEERNNILEDENAKKESKIDDFDRKIDKLEKDFEFDKEELEAEHESWKRQNQNEIDRFLGMWKDELESKAAILHGAKSPNIFNHEKFESDQFSVDKKLVQLDGDVRTGEPGRFLHTHKHKHVHKHLHKIIYHHLPNVNKGGGAKGEFEEEVPKEKHTYTSTFTYTELEIKRIKTYGF